MKKIRWKYLESTNEYEGYVEDEVLFSIQGRLCVTDLRPCRTSKIWEAPEHYRIKDVEDAKRIAHDLLNDLNLSEHHANRDKWIEEQNKTSKLIKEVDELLKKLKNN